MDDRRGAPEDDPGDGAPAVPAADRDGAGASAGMVRVPADDPEWVAVARDAIEWIFDAPYDEVLARFAAEMRATGSTEADLIALGLRVIDDAARVGRAEASAILVPERAPMPGEHGHRAETPTEADARGRREGPAGPDGRA